MRPFQPYHPHASGFTGRWKLPNRYIRDLEAEERSHLEAAALAEASEDARETYANPAIAAFKDSVMLGMLREHVGRLLAEVDLASVQA